MRFPPATMSTPTYSRAFKHLEPNGGFAYDDQELRNGVFSLAVIDGLRGVAPADAKTGFVTARTLADYVGARVGEWVKERGRDTGADTGWTSSTFEGEGADLPLAVHIDGAVPRLGNRRPTVDNVGIAIDGLVARLVDVRCSDPDKNDAVQTVEVAWGDGATDERPLADAGKLTHTYGTFVEFEVAVTAVDRRQGRSTREAPAKIAEPSGLLLHREFDDIQEEKRALADSSGRNQRAEIRGIRATRNGNSLDNVVNGWRAGSSAVYLRNALANADHVPFSESFTIAAVVNMDSNSGNDRIAGPGNSSASSSVPATTACCACTAMARRSVAHR